MGVVDGEHLLANVGWILGIAFHTVAAYEKSIAQCPNIKPGQELTGYKTALSKSA